MNQLETNLVLWAICSILLFEILFIICLCRCCFNRIKPKKFYVKREEFEYLQNGPNNTQSKFHSTILRPPHADELALVGTIRPKNSLINYNGGIQNLGFYHDDEDERIPSIQPRSSQNWIELQSSRINTAQLLPAEYEIHSQPTNDYFYTSSYPRSTLFDLHQYRQNDELANNRFQSLRHPDIYYPQVHRIDTSTDSYAMNYSTVMPKSILKGSVSTTPPLDLISTPYLQTQDNHTSSNYDESPRTSAKITIPVAYPSSRIEERIPDTSLPMRFASLNQLNDVQWEVPREFRTVIYDLNDNKQLFRSNEDLNHSNNQDQVTNRQRTQSAIVDQNTHRSRVRELNNVQPDYLSNNNITQQQAFEY